MKNRILSFLLSVLILFTTISGTILNVNAFDIDESGAFLHYTAANMARILGNTNIYYAHFYGQDYNGEKSVENRLRVRSTSMLYQHFADIEKENDVKAVFADVWDVLSIDTERFSGLTETDFYSGVLWAMLTGNFNLSSESVDSQMEDFENVANGMILEFVEWYCTSVAKEDATAKASEILKKWDIEDQSLLNQVQIWYGDHYSTISEQVANEKSFFDSTDKIFEYSGYIMQFCGSALDYLTKMSQIEALYGMSHVAYVDFLTEFVNDSTLDPQLINAAENILVLMTQESYEDALDQYILDLVCQDGKEIVLGKLSDVLEEVGEKVLEKVGSTTASSILLGIKLGMEAADLILGVEDKLAVRYNILLLDSMTDAVFNTAERLRQNYYPSLSYNFGEFAAGRTINAELSSLADAYVASVEMCYRFLLQTDVYVENYINEQYNNWWNGFWGDDEEIYNTYMDVLESEIAGLQRSYKNTTSDAKELYEDFCEQLVNEIIYDADGWNNVPANQVKEFYVDVTLSSQIPTKSGYTFGGWYDSVNGGYYKPGAVFDRNFSEDIILLPTWNIVDLETEKPTSITEVESIMIYSTDNQKKAVEVGKVRHIPQVSSDPYYCKDYWINGTYDTSAQSGSLCTRAVYSMALSYLGIDCTPGRMAELMQTTGDIPTVYYDNVTSKLQSQYTGLERVTSSNSLAELYENYQSDHSYSPVYVRFGATDSSVGHAALVVGRSSTNPNEYYCVEPSFSWDGTNAPIHIVTMVVSADEKTATDYTWSSCRNRTIDSYYQWQNTNITSGGNSENNTTTTYTITYDANGGSNVPAAQTKTHGIPLTLSNTIILRDGYVFKGWARTADAQEAEFSIGSSFNIDANTTLYAVWGTSSSSTAITLSGTVKDATVGGANYGNPLSGVTVEFFNSNGTSIGSSVTNSEGVYTFTFPAPGTYKKVLSKEGYNIFTVDTNIIVENTPSLGISTLTEVEKVEERNIIAEGTCGADLTWALDDEGLLTVDGIGAMSAYSSTSMPWNAYKAQTKYVQIGEGVTTIGESAFSGCKVLTKVTMSDTVTSIGAYAFENCRGLTEVYLGAALTNIGREAFYQCSSLEKITLPDKLTTISTTGSGAFAGTAIKKVIIPDSVTTVSNTIYNLSTITMFEVEDLDGVGYRSDNGVLYHYNEYTEVLTLVRCPQSKGIATTYAILDDTDVIGSNAFYGVSTLKKITMPANITTIGSYAFYNCDLLNTVTLNTGLGNIGERAFHDCDALKEIVIPEGVTTIGESAFSGCEVLAKVTMSDTVTSIGAYAFENCRGLTEVYLGAALSNIGREAFYQCSSLESAYFFGKTPSVNTSGSGAFTGVKSTFTMYYIEGNEGWTSPAWNGYKTATFIPEDTTVAVTGIKLSSSAITLSVDDTHTLTATVTPENATDKTVTWTSSNKAVATVANGKVTAVGAGTTVIIATTKDGGFTATCIVTVEGKQEVTEDTPVVQLSDVRGNPGGTITVPVVIANNPGIASMTLNVEFDESIFTLTSVVDTGLIPGSMHTERYSSPYILTWDNDTAKENYTANGTLVNLVFTVAENAELGDYTIKISYPQDGIFDTDVNNVDFHMQNGTVTVSNIIIGDATGDGALTNKDRVYLARYLAGWEGYDESVIDKTAADVNCDGALTNKDRVYLARHLAGWEGYETLPIT